MNVGKIMLCGAGPRYHPDANIDFVKSLLHFDGANASTTFTDALGHTWTGAGNAQIATAQSLSGGSSLYLDGTGDYITGDGSADFSFGTGDFTIEMFIRAAATGITRLLWDTRGSGTGGTANHILIYASSANQLQFLTNGSVRIQGASSILNAIWYHVALSRASGVTRMFLDGSQQGSDYTDTNSYSIGTARPIIGSNGNSPSSDFWNGHIEDIRVTKGVGRYTANFTAPTAPFPNP